MSSGSVDLAQLITAVNSPMEFFQVWFTINFGMKHIMYFLQSMIEYIHLGEFPCKTDRTICFRKTSY